KIRATFIWQEAGARAMHTVVRKTSTLGGRSRESRIARRTTSTRRWNSMVKADSSRRGSESQLSRKRADEVVLAPRQGARDPFRFRDYLRCQSERSDAVTRGEVFALLPVELVVLGRRVA